MNNNWKYLEINRQVIDRIEKQIHEASSVLKYSLYLKPIEITTTKEVFSNSLIEDANNKTFENLKTFTEDKRYDIFGYREINKKNGLSGLSWQAAFWEHIFKQHAILSAYDRLRKILGQSVNLSSYYFCKYSNYTNNKDNFDKCHHGLDYLLGLNEKNACQELDFDKLRVNRNYMAGPVTGKLSQYSPNHAKRIASLNKQLTSLGLHGLITPIQESQQTARLDLLEFYEFSVRREIKKNNHNEFSVCPKHEKTNKSKDDKETDDSFKIFKILNTYKKEYLSCEDYHMYKSYIGKMFDTIKFGHTGKNRHKLSLSDRIYLAYEIEKFLAPVTIDCLHQNIFNIQKGNPLKDDYNYIINSCLQLPNVFTRQYILQIAVDTITKHFDENFTDTYFLNKITENLESVGIFFEKKDFINQQQKFYFLLNRYQTFIDYMTKIVFPLYENYFFCTLWDSISKSCKSNTATFINFYKKLSIYLNNPENVEKIFNTEKIIEDCGINVDSIIKTDFINNKDIHCSTCTKQVKYDKYNKTLYSECFKALKIFSNENHIPDFITLDYITGNYSGKKNRQENKEPKFKKLARANVIKNMMDN